MAKHGEIIKAEFDIFALQRKTQRVNRWTKGTTNANPVNDIQTKISSLTKTKDNIFLKPKDNRTYGERVVTVLELDTGAKRFGRHDQDGGNRHNRAISPRKRMQIEALKEACEG